MKKIIFTTIMLSSLLLTACGSKADETSYSSTANNNKAIMNEAYFAGDESMADYESDNYQENSDSDSESDITKLSDKTNNTSDEIIKKEMLVYSCNMTVDVLDFSEYINSLKNNINTYSAFVENENYSDGGSNNRWYNADGEKWQSYSATIRVPSADYESFCDDIAKLGDLRSKNASVKNMSREYYDLSSDLEIYEAKEARYMELLSTIKDEQYALKVENELTDIQIEISRIKTRMNDIKTDVAYSYVYLTVNEVREYVEEPEYVETDTFGQRFKNTVSRASSGFLNFMEKLLFLCIYLLPYALVIGLFVFIIVKICLFADKRRKKRMQTANPVISETPAPPAVPDIPDTEENNENK